MIGGFKLKDLVRDEIIERTQEGCVVPDYTERLQNADRDELERIYRETRNLESRTLRNDKSSDTECEAAARAVFEQKKNEAEIELQYFDKFKEILTPQQLLRLRSAERTFVQHVVNAHNRRRASK